MIIPHEIERLRNTLDECLDRLELLDTELRRMPETDGLALDEVMQFVKSEMRNRGMTQKDLAEKTGYSAPGVNRWLRGSRKAPLDFIIGALQALGYRMEILPARRTPLPFEDIGE